MNHIDALRAVFPHAVHVKELDPSSDLAKTGEVIELLYTLTVEALTTHPSPVLADRMRRLWDAVHQRKAFTAVTEIVPTVGFALVKEQCMVLIPPKWPTMFAADPFMQTGAVICTGSQIVDYCNGRFDKEDPDHIETRGVSYEAEFLKDFRSQKLNAYQEYVLKKFPQGFNARYAYPYTGVTAGLG